MSTTNPLILESVSTTIRKSIKSTSVHLLSKNVQRNWFDFCTNDRRSFIRLFCLIILIISLNFFVTTFFTTLMAQITVGLGGNIMYWHHPYIQPEPDIDNNDNMKIPKIIHQTYKSLDSIPSRWQNSVNQWKLYHPDWEYKFWSDDEIDAFMHDHYSWFIPFYDSYPNHIQRVDVARYFILYHYGGIYCDLDIAPKRNIQPLLQNNIDIFLVETPNLGTTNSLFGSIKHSDFLFYVMDHLSEYHNTGWYQWFLPKHLKILFSTGPTAFWSLYGRFYSNQINPKQTFGILHNKYFGRLPVCSPNPGQQQQSLQSASSNISTASSPSGPTSSASLFGCDMVSFQQSYFQHVEGNSWHNTSSWYINYFLGCQPITTLFMLCVLIWTIYYGVYINTHKYKKSLKVWCRKHLLFLSVSTLLIWIMYSWRFILFSLQTLQCY